MLGVGTSIPATKWLKEQRRQHELQQGGPWLDAHHDALAGVHAINCMSIRLCDLIANDDWRVVIVDYHLKKLRVYHGVSLQSEHNLLDTPVSLAVFYPNKNVPRIPSIAVASGPYIFIYRALRPYFKFTLPLVEVDEREIEVWQMVREDKVTAWVCAEKLRDLRDEGVQLTAQSDGVLMRAERIGGAGRGSLAGAEEKHEDVGDDVPSEANELEEFVTSVKMRVPVQLSVVTCMESLVKSQDNDVRAESMLVVGTEAKQVLILDSSGTSIRVTVKLPSVPAFIAVSGTFDVSYRITVACRNGCIYQIKKGKVLGTRLQLQSQIAGLCIVGKTIAVACMDSSVHSFFFKGKKNFSLYMPHPITCMTVFNHQSTRALLFALRNGDIRMYNGKELIHSIATGENVTAMCTGQYGREEALVYIGKSGSFTVKLLKRQAKLNAGESIEMMSSDQDIPLRIPKKTRLFVEQTQRERDKATSIHSMFQRDLCRLRLSAARTYVKILTTDGHGAGARNNALQLDASVLGLGPAFVLKLAVKNNGSRPVMNLHVKLSFDHSIYRVQQSAWIVPLLLPTIAYEFDTEITCVVLGEPVAGEVRVYIGHPKSVRPIVSAVLQMPTPSMI